MSHVTSHVHSPAAQLLARRKARLIKPWRAVPPTKKPRHVYKVGWKACIISLSPLMIFEQPPHSNQSCASVPTSLERRSVLWARGTVASKQWSNVPTHGTHIMFPESLANCLRPKVRRASEGSATGGQPCKLNMSAGQALQRRRPIAHQ